MGSETSPFAPDFRSSVYWNPSVVSDASGRALVEFYCSDDVSKIRIIVEGMTSGALPFTTSTTDAGVEIKKAQQ